VTIERDERIQFHEGGWPIMRFRRSQNRHCMLHRTRPFGKLRAGSSQRARRTGHPFLRLCRRSQKPGPPA